MASGEGEVVPDSDSAEDLASGGSFQVRRFAGATSKSKQTEHDSTRALNRFIWGPAAIKSCDSPGIIPRRFFLWQRALERDSDDLIGWRRAAIPSGGIIVANSGSDDDGTTSTIATGMDLPAAASGSAPAPRQRARPRKGPLLFPMTPLRAILIGWLRAAVASQSGGEHVVGKAPLPSDSGRNSSGDVIGYCVLSTVL